MTKLVVTSRISAKGTIADTTVFEGGSVHGIEVCAYDFAKAMNANGYHVTLSLEILVLERKRGNNR